MTRLAQARRLYPIGATLRFVRYWDDFTGQPRNNIWDDTRQSGFSDPKVYVVQTNTRVIERCLLMTTDPGDLVLDPTCGSGTTAYVAEQWGRRWITIDTSRVALALARTRLMAAKYPYYLLADSPEGQRKEAELTGAPPLGSDAEGDIRKGFVYERVPHVTLKSIAQNPDIREGMTRDEIDAAIARHADTETLYDRPYEDRKVVRVAGPFTVESLSPHRVVADSPDDLVDAPAPVEDSGRFVETILENLRASGVDNRSGASASASSPSSPTRAGSSRPQAPYREGEALRTVAVALGPEYGTVGRSCPRGRHRDRRLLRPAPRVRLRLRRPGRGEARPSKHRQAHRPDGPDEPRPRHGRRTAEEDRARQPVHGFRRARHRHRGRRQDGSSPSRSTASTSTTRPPARSAAATDDIACWFIDTDYNGEAFFVRHAYFLGADDPYDKLKRALPRRDRRGRWASLYSTVSRPFPRPATGRIAVKVINHYGDEILKVYGV